MSFQVCCVVHRSSIYRIEPREILGNETLITTDRKPSIFRFRQYENNFSPFTSLLQSTQNAVNVGTFLPVTNPLIHNNIVSSDFHFDPMHRWRRRLSCQIRHLAHTIENGCGANRKKTKKKIGTITKRTHRTNYSGKSIVPKDKRMKRLYFNFWNVSLRLSSMRWTQRNTNRLKMSKKIKFSRKNVVSCCHFWTFFLLHGNISDRWLLVATIYMSSTVFFLCMYFISTGR